jgi:hypothetical protein
VRPKVPPVGSAPEGKKMSENSSQKRSRRI